MDDPRFADGQYEVMLNADYIEILQEKAQDKIDKHVIEQKLPENRGDKRSLGINFLEQLRHKNAQCQEETSEIKDYKAHQDLNTDALAEIARPEGLFPLLC